MIVSPAVSIAGLGYIGLPTAVFMANAGIRVMGADVQSFVRDKVAAGAAHIHEPGLDELVSKAVSAGMLTVHEALQAADFYVICVPTPVTYSDDGQSPDLKYVVEVASEIGALIKDGDIVILESTSPVGTTEQVRSIIARLSPNTKFTVAYCPERVLPGQMIAEFQSNPRIIGCDDEETAKKIATLYGTFTGAELRLTNAKTAEMCKLVENAYRDVNIAFANELSIISEVQGVDVWELRRLANLHPRVDILMPGPGVGGHCISVDPWFLVSGDPANTKLIKAARAVNDSKPEWVKTQCLKAIDDFGAKVGRPPNIALYGVAFKPNVDDIRGSPALNIARSILEQNANTVVVDPFATPDLNLPLMPIETALSFADLHIVLVNHSVFASHFGSVKAESAFELLDFCGMSRV